MTHENYFLFSELPASTAFWENDNKAVVYERKSFFHFCSLLHCFTNRFKSLLTRHTIGANGFTFKHNAV